jgi:hypothetical protein
MKDNSTPRPGGHDLLAHLSIDEVLAFHLIEFLADETFTKQYAKAHNIECVSPDYQRLSN